MKKITLLLFSFFLLSSFTALAQFIFPTIAGPTNVAAGSPVTLNINDMANTSGVTADIYYSFSITVDWVVGGGDPWSVEAGLSIVTTAGTASVDPPSTGGASNGDDTALTFAGFLAGPYDAATDGFLDIVLNQSYGGSDADWSNIVITLSTTQQPPIPANDDCSGAIVLTPGATFGDNPLDGSVVSATADAQVADCAFNGPGIWYSIVVPADGNITIETGPDAGTGNTNFDSVIEAFSGTCGALVTIGCNDDYPTSLFSLLDLTGLTPSSTIYVRVWEYEGDEFEPFAISAYNATLGIGDNKIGGFKLYPNPVNYLLKFSAQETINNISIYSLLGQEVMRIQPNTIKSQVDISNLSTGMYLVKVQVGDKIGSYRIIKQ